ncbi:hypothetical protein EV192_10114 [Actinocrispum wychmicini]|uniref:Uncharacterized protein n=1 Tax=Actinocrispum wychmicini TaxID=1213861 RepID=A0A4V2S8K7_9PSEU|nr:hypothetical protein EV192_10114 [Actinocrispum wychmicini]
MIYDACRALAGEDRLARVYCVTLDRGFLEARRQNKLTDHSTVLAPSVFWLLSGQFVLLFGATHQTELTAISRRGGRCGAGMSGGPGWRNSHS